MPSAAAFGKVVAYAAMVVSFLSLGYCFYSENVYLRTAHLINFHSPSKHFVNATLIFLAFFTIAVLAALLLNSRLSGAMLAGMSALFLILQIGTVFYTLYGMPRAIESFHGIWNDVRASAAVERSLRCCADEKNETRGPCVAKKTCRVKITNHMKERSYHIIGGLSTSVVGEIGLIVSAVILILRGDSRRAKGGYEELQVTQADLIE